MTLGPNGGRRFLCVAVFGMMAMFGPLMLRACRATAVSGEINGAYYYIPSQETDSCMSSNMYIVQDHYKASRLELDIVVGARLCAALCIVSKF
jgi:hypothetical protein